MQNDAQRRIRASLLLQWVLVPSWLQLALSAVWIDSVVVRFLADPLRAAITVVLALACSATILWFVWRYTGRTAGFDIQAELKAASCFSAKLVVVWRWYRVVQLWWLVGTTMAAAAALLNILGVIATP